MRCKNARTHIHTAGARQHGSARLPAVRNRGDSGPHAIREGLDGESDSILPEMHAQVVRLVGTNKGKGKVMAEDRTGVKARRRKAPYSGTEVPAEKTKFQIEKLLREFGAQAAQWATVWEQDKVQLKFAMPTEGGRSVVIRIDPPLFMSERKNWNKLKGKYDVTEEPNWAQSMRLLYHYLKGKLEAIAWGLKDVEEEFLNDIVVRGPKGEEATVGQLIDSSALAEGKLQALPPGRNEE